MPVSSDGAGLGQATAGRRIALSDCVAACRPLPERVATWLSLASGSFVRTDSSQAASPHLTINPWSVSGHTGQRDRSDSELTADERQRIQRDCLTDTRAGSQPPATRHGNGLIFCRQQERPTSHHRRYGAWDRTLWPRALRLGSESR